MGPVSFQRVGHDLDRAGLRALAMRLRESGIAVQSADGDSTLLVRSEDFERAQAVIDSNIAD